MSLLESIVRPFSQNYKMIAKKLSSVVTLRLQNTVIYDKILIIYTFFRKAKINLSLRKNYAACSDVSALGNDK